MKNFAEKTQGIALKKDRFNSYAQIAKIIKKTRNSVISICTMLTLYMC